MSSIFVKIFLWFWLAMALVVGALVVSVILTQSSPQLSRWRDVAGDAMSLYAQASVEVYQRRGRPALRRYLRQLELNTGIRSGLFDANGVEISGFAVPPEARPLAVETLQSGEVQLRVLGPTILAAERVTASDGAVYVLVGQIPRRLIERQLDPAGLALRMLAVVLTGGLLCYGLARYLTSPILRLKEAARRLAGGDLRARFGLEFAGRKDELSDLGRDFDEMADRIENLLRSERRLLSDISHELRSPLARLNVALELARKRSGTDSEGYLDRIEREAERMNTLIGQLLQLARMENGAPPGEKATVKLAELLRDIAADADFEAGGTNRSVRVSEAEECAVAGFPELLRSAIENVVRNAVRYTPENTAVEISLRKITSDGQPQAVVAVRDQGPGVPPGSLKDMFRPFYRVSDARERGSGAAGLGLAIAERAVLLHGGRIHADNAAGGGLQVEIELPLKAS